MRDSALEEPPDLRIWTARCMVCEARFVDTEPHEHNPYPHGAFCWHCQDAGRMAPGVLHFKPARARQL